MPRMRRLFSRSTSGMPSPTTWRSLCCTTVIGTRVDGWRHWLGVSVTPPRSRWPPQMMMSNTPLPRLSGCT